jgi:hypothetical protein
VYITGCNSRTCSIAHYRAEKEIVSERKQRMIIEDKELTTKKRSHINGNTCSLLYHSRLKVYFVCRDETVVFVGEDFWAIRAYEGLIKASLEQVYVIEEEQVVNGSFA